MKRLLLILAISLALLVGCSELDHGTVLDRRYTKDFFYTTMQCSGGFNNQPYMCIPITNYSPEQWELYLRANGDEGYEYGWRHVSEHEFGKYEDGSYYP